MKNFFVYKKIRIHRIIVGVLICAIFTFFLFLKLININSANSRAIDLTVSHAYEVIRHIDNIESSVAETESATRAYVATGDTRWRESFYKTSSDLNKLLSETSRLLNSQGQQKELAVLEKIIHDKLDFQRLAINNNSISSDINEKIRYSNEARKIALIVQSEFRDLRARQDLLLQQRLTASADARNSYLITAIIGAVLLFIFIIAALLRLNRDMRGRQEAEQEVQDSGNKYKQLIEEAGVTMFTSDLSGKFTYVSSRCQSLTGYTAAYLTGKNFATLVDPAWVNEVAIKYQQQMSQRKAESVIEFPIITSHGEQRWVEQTAVLQVDTYSKPSGLQCVVKDITEKKLAESKLKRSEEQIRTVLNNTREGFIMVSRSFEIQVLNKKASEDMQMVTGRVPETGMNIFSFVRDAQRERTVQNFERVFEGELVDFEFKYEIGNAIIWTRVSYSPVRDNEGSVIGAAVVTHDITQARLSQEKEKIADQKIRAMLSSTHEGFYMIGDDYSILMVNEAGKQTIEMVTGKKCKLGDNIMNYVEGERMEMLPELFKRVMKGMTEEMEACMDTPEGEKWFHSSYFPIRDENNQVTAFCVTSKDITERKLTEHALNRIRAEREEYQFRLQSMLDNSPSIVFIKDLEGRYLIINKAFRNALCLTDEQVIGKTDFDFDRSEMAAHFKKTDDEVVNTLRSIEMEESFDSATGRQNFLFVKFPLFDKENRIYGIGGIATDLTENMENRQKLIAARKKAEKAEQLQEQFLANMSHEIRTPMNGITGMTNILMTTELDEQQQEYVKIIKQSSDNLLVLINDILDLSKIKSGKLSLEKMDFNLRETLDFTLAPFYLKAKERNISLQLMQDSALPGMINGDPYRLAQILNNLLSNALKFTERGTIRLHVKIKPEKEDVLEFSVTDTGIGIPADKLVSIFNSFEQASSSTTRKFGGTGLGLTITKKLVELLEGEINVTSVPGEGTSFNFTIPYEIIQKDNDMKTIQGGASTSDTAGLANKKILVVEDNEINQKVISLILGKQGIKTEIAENGKVAVDRLEEGNVYDLIIMDLHMPVMDGFQAATYMRQKLKITIPIIAMTASVLGNERARCFELGMDEYLSKPFVPAELFVTLKRFLTAPLFTPMQVVGSVKPVAKLYDLTYLRSMDDKKYLCEILELFLNTTPTILEELQNDVLSEHWDSIEKKAHKLKSSLGILQMNEIMELVSTIEIKAKERLESDKIQQALKLTIEQFGLVRPMLESELAAAS